MAKSKEERVRFANVEILGKGNLAAVDEIFATDTLSTQVARIIKAMHSSEDSSNCFVRRFRIFKSWRSLF